MRHRPNQLICGIDVTAFVSVMLVLVFTFMIGKIFDTFHPGNSVDLAKVSSPVSMRGANREDATIVSIRRDGKLFFRSDLVMPDQLAAKIRESVDHGSERKVYIRADAHAKYEKVAEVLDGVHAAGIEKIGFLVEQRRPHTPDSQVGLTVSVR
jgi:biopolymer transport protein TolR